MITIEGIRINTSIQALQQGQGFLVQVNASWNTNRDNELKKAQRKAQEEDIIGSLLNGHESTYADAETTITSVVDQFETDITQFITDWNNGVYEN